MYKISSCSSVTPLLNVDGGKEASRTYLQVCISKTSSTNYNLRWRHIEAYSRKLDVINRGLGGYQTDWAIPICEQVKYNVAIL
jgi:hypothetical protein